MWSWLWKHHRIIVCSSTEEWCRDLKAPRPAGAWRHGPTLQTAQMLRESMTAVTPAAVVILLCEYCHAIVMHNPVLSHACHIYYFHIHKRCHFLYIYIIQRKLIRTIISTLDIKLQSLTSNVQCKAAHQMVQFCIITPHQQIKCFLRIY